MSIHTGSAVIPQSIKRLDRSREIAAAVALLARPLSNHITGAFIRVVGGAADAIGVRDTYQPWTCSPDRLGDPSIPFG